jgi:phage tail-like protein
MRKRDFQFLTINTKSLWKHFSKKAENINIKAEGISLHKEPGYIFSGKPDALPSCMPVDLAIDECGVLYILDAGKCNILIYDPDTKCSEWLECFGGCGLSPGTLCDPKAIALSSSDIYIAEPCSHRVQAFARINFQVRRVYSLESEMEPLDLAVDSQDNLYILASQPPSILFVAGSEFQTDLDKKNIPEEFRQKFSDHGKPLSSNVKVVIEEKEIRWLIVDRELLFSVEVEAQSDLNNGVISEGLRQEFEDNNIALSDDACVSVKESDARWLITDGDKGYIIEKQEGELNIYDRDKTETYAVRKEEDKLNIYDLNFVIQRFSKSGKRQVSFSEGLGKPTHLTARDGFIYVLEAAHQKVLRFSIQTDEHGEFTIKYKEFDISGNGEEMEFSGIAVDKAQNVYYMGKKLSPDAETEEAEEEKHIFLYKLDTAEKSTKKIKIIALPGMYDRLHMDRAGNLYALDGEAAGEVAVLESAQLFSRNGSYVSKALDSGMSGLQWHKIVVEAEIPEKTQITVSYHVSDDYVKDEEQIPSDAWSELSPADPEDALILSSNGRYLWLRFTLFGDERSTPEVKSVKAYFPRLSYLRYLPGIYQEDEASRDFLERFLSLFETFFFNLEDEIFSVTKYLDVIATPHGDSPENDFLSWLGSWLAVAFDENWCAAKKREFLKAVPQLYKKRGTRAGLQEFIKIYTGKEPIIVESFQIQRIEDEKIKPIWKALFIGDLYSFCVLLQPQQAKTASRLSTVKRIVQSEKPAHTSGGVVELQPWIYLDMHTYLGVNSTLPEPVFRLGKTSVISRDTALSDPESGGQLERHARLGMDTILT